MSHSDSHQSAQLAPSAGSEVAVATAAGSAAPRTQNVAAPELPMGVHPYVWSVALAGWGVAVLLLFLLFLFLGSEATGVVVLVGIVSLLMLGLIVGCGIASRNVATRAGVRVRQPASFREFLSGEVQVGDDHMKGSEIFGLAVVMGLTLAIIGVGMVVAIAVA